MADVRLMAGKFVLVTGGTGGIGEATATGLAALGARVGITGRDQARTEAAAAGIRAGPGSPAVDAFAADMSVQAGVRRLADQVADTYPRLDVLVNNVGGFWAHRHLTADGLERTFALNHLAPFLLTSLLLDRLTASAPARIVTVSSGAHAGGCIDFGDLQGERDYSGQRAYGQSKLANVMFTYELARRLEGTGVTATVCHPGVVRTSFGAEDQAAHMAGMIRVARLFMKTPAQGALTPVYLASSPQVEGVTGQYYANRKPTTSGKAAYDTTAAARLWQASAGLRRHHSNRIMRRRKHPHACLRQRSHAAGSGGTATSMQAGVRPPVRDAPHRRHLPAPGGAVVRRSGAEVCPFPMSIVLSYLTLWAQRSSSACWRGPLAWRQRTAASGAGAVTFI